MFNVPNKTTLLTENMVVRKLTEVSLRLAQRIETHFPGTNYGLWRHYHMQEAAQGSAQLAQSAGLSDHEATLLKIILCCHDLGRYVEFSLRQRAADQNKTPVLLNHGHYSAVILEKMYNAHHLTELTREDFEVIKQAVRWHGERIVQLPQHGPAYKLCYLLRDQDKLEIFSQDAGGQYDVAFCRKELTSTLRVLSPHDIHECNARQREVEDYLRSYFGSSSPSVMSGKDALFTKIHAACSLRLEAQHEAVQAVIKKRSADASRCYQSFSALFLCHIAMVFDLQYPHSFARIVSEHMLEFKWQFVQRHTSSELYAKLRDSYDAFIDAGIARGNRLAS